MRRLRVTGNWSAAIVVRSCNSATAGIAQLHPSRPSRCGRTVILTSAGGRIGGKPGRMAGRNVLPDHPSGGNSFGAAHCRRRGNSRTGNRPGRLDARRHLVRVGRPAWIDDRHQPPRCRGERAIARREAGEQIVNDPALNSVSVFGPGYVSKPGSLTGATPGNGFSTEGRSMSGLAKRHRWESTDTLQLLAVLFAAAIWCWWFGWRGSQPFEDATILFRYVDNVAAGHGIVWNVGEAPVDGATDLGFMLVLAAIRTSGVGAQAAALIVNSLAFLCIAGGLFAFARLRQIPVLLAILVTALFIFSPAVTLIHAGFGAVFFSASVATVALAMFRLIDQPTRRNALILACTGTVAGLIRPEGFLIAGVFIATAAVVVGRPLLRLPLLSGALLLLAGLAFLLSRWAYFGFPLPNPYYKKGGGTLHLDGLEESIRFARTVGALPIFLLIAIAVLGSFSRRWIAYIGCTGVLLGMWLLLSSEMNYNYRFQFPIFVVLLLMVIDLGSRELPSFARRAATIPSSIWRLAPVLVVAVVAVQFVANQYRFAPLQTAPPVDGAAAKVLAASGQHDLVVATTEAGYVCWQSGWRCIDLWGLNDKRIAHEGFLNEGQLEELDPDVIVLHAPTSPTASSINAASGFLPGWEKMTNPLIRFAESRRYVLAAVLSPEIDSGQAVYVRPGEDWSNRLISEFGAIEPTIESFYGPSAGPRPTLPTNAPGTPRRSPTAPYAHRASP